MRIDHTAFGEITINGKTYDHDVIIRLSGEIVKRNCVYGTSHIVSKDEAKFVFEKGCRQLILGSGQDAGTCSSLRRQMLSSPRRTATLLFSRHRRPFAPLMKRTERKSVCST